MRKNKIGWSVKSNLALLLALVIFSSLLVAASPNDSNDDSVFSFSGKVSDDSSDDSNDDINDDLNDDFSDDSSDDLNDDSEDDDSNDSSNDDINDDLNDDSKDDNSDGSSDDSTIRLSSEYDDISAIARSSLTQMQIDCENNFCEVQVQEESYNGESVEVYSVSEEKQVRLFGFIPTKMNVQIKVHSQTGEVLENKKSWWGFLAAED